MEIMKYFLLIFGIIATANASFISENDQALVDLLLRNKLENRAYEAELRALLEKLRELMPVGDPDLGIPILDPFELEQLDIEYELPLTALIKLYLEQITATGLQGFEVNNINFNILRLRLDFDFTIPSIKVLAGLYDLDALIMNSYKFFGNGSVDVEALNLHFDGFATITIRDGFLFMNNFNITFKLEQFKSNISGLLGGGEVSLVFNKILEELVPALIDSQSEDISELVGGVVKDFANQYLTQLTLSDLIDIITGGGSGTTTPKPLI